MAIKFVKENGTCEWCGECNTLVTKSESLDVAGRIFMCEDCIVKNEKNKERKCTKCKERVWSKGGLRKSKGKDVCLECMNVIIKKKESRKEKIYFIKKHWQFWIATSLTIVGLLIAVNLLS